MAKHLQHIHSRVLDSNTGKPKQPTAQQIEYGEIAINYKEGNETLFVKNDNDEIVPFLNGNAIENIIEENELVTAAAISEVRRNIANMSEDIEENERVIATALTTFDDKFTTMQSIVDENEEITAQALSDLDKRITQNTNVLETIDTDCLKSVTYNELLTLVNEAQLKPGTYYRITDYETKCSAYDTMYADHLFDVIVLAISEDTLSEDARAIQHEGDTYFEKCNLSAWELKYTIENDINRFTWAYQNSGDSTGKGVIYYMKDEHGNEAPYDFKNIKFKRYKVEQGTGGDAYDGQYVGYKTRIGDVEKVYPYTYAIPDDDDFIFCYTFSGVVVDYDIEHETVTPPSGHIDDTSKIVDLSVYDTDWYYNASGTPFGVTNNVIKSCNDFLTYTTRLLLNNIVMTGWAVNKESLPDDYEQLFGDKLTLMMNCPANNIFENTCNGLTLFDGCKFNRFAENCSDMVFGNDCNSNIFGNDCKDNIFADSCSNNVFDYACARNRIGDGSSNNIFGQHMSGHTFVGGAINNVIMRGFTANVVNTNFRNNYVGLNCSGTTFGASFQYNTLGNNTISNRFGSNLESNHIGDNVKTFEAKDARFNVIGDNVSQLIFVPSYVEYVTVESNNQGIQLTSTQTPSDLYPLQNIVIKTGVNNDLNNIKIISHNTLADNFITEYANTNTVTVNV